MENFGKYWSCNYLDVAQYFEYKYRRHGVAVRFIHARGGALGKPSLPLKATTIVGMLGRSSWKIEKSLDIPTDEDGLKNLAYLVDKAIEEMIDKSQKHQLDLF